MGGRSSTTRCRTLIQKLLMTSPCDNCFDFCLLFFPLSQVLSFVWTLTRRRHPCPKETPLPEGDTLARRRHPCQKETPLPEGDTVARRRHPCPKQTPLPEVVRQVAAPCPFFWGSINEKIDRETVSLLQQMIISISAPPSTPDFLLLMLLLFMFRRHYI